MSSAGRASLVQTETIFFVFKFNQKAGPKLVAVKNAQDIDAGIGQHLLHKALHPPERKAMPKEIPLRGPAIARDLLLLIKIEKGRQVPIHAQVRPSLDFRHLPGIGFRIQKHGLHSLGMLCQQGKSRSLGILDIQMGQRQFAFKAIPEPQGLAALM